ncbi:SDR family NAD(P)-dependent oxidoreductase [Streptosporangium soli]|nr:SDR family NAD(P)-dependent oxidoreductase [Streptosporangium sp. KLBMP 9127]
MGSLDGRVALITGAGRGIGRAEALFFAAEGAKVVVNDPGVAADGTGGDPGVAEEVAEEIRAAGGTAVANSDSVADWEGARRMVEQAVATFGDLHVVVNNAGNERARALVNMTEEEFDSVVAVHLKGTFAVSRWAARYWRDHTTAGVDRAIVNTVSGSGVLNPLPTQSNYAAAKAGIAAMSTVHALELARQGVRVNCVSPSMARTRLTLGVPGMSEESHGHDPRDPAAIAPVAAYLASAGCPFNGEVFAVRGATVTAVLARSRGAEVTKDGAAWNVAELAGAMDRLPRHDPLAELAATLGGALGGQDRDRLLAMIDEVLR